jgi:hypothetical protein
MGQPKLVDTLTIRKFINTHRGIIYGMMLGDSSVINRGAHAAFRVLHAEDQKSLVFHKWEQMKEVAPTPPRAYLHKWGQPKWYFYTACDVEWQKVWSIFHQDNKVQVLCGKRTHIKVVTPQILSQVDDRALAHWIMDDGSYTYGHQQLHPEKPMNVFRLHTEGFSRGENELMAEWFRKKYGVNPTVLPSKKVLQDGTRRTYWFIRIGWRDFEKVAERVSPYIIPSMVHKIGRRPPQDKGQLAQSELKTHSELCGNAESRLEIAGRHASQERGHASNRSDQHDAGQPAGVAQPLRSRRVHG